MDVTEKALQLKQDFDDVKAAGYIKGEEIGHSQGYVNGRQDEQDRFWNEFQENGKREYYPYAFSGWTDDIYNPKHPVIVGAIGTNYSTGLFMYSKITKKIGPELVWKSYSAQACFMQSAAEEIEVDFSARNGAPVTMQNTFHTANAHTIKLKNGVFTYCTYTFLSCSNLVNLILENCVFKAQGSANFRCDNAKLTKESLIGLFNSLEDLTAEGASATTQTLNIGATNLAKLTTEEKQIATNKGWTLI